LGVLEVPKLNLQFDLPIQKSSLKPYSYEKSISEEVSSGKTISINNTPIMTSRVFVSERALPSLEGSVSFLNSDSESSCYVSPLPSPNG